MYSDRDSSQELSFTALKKKIFTTSKALWTTWHQWNPIDRSLISSFIPNNDFSKCIWKQRENHLNCFCCCFFWSSNWLKCWPLYTKTSPTMAGSGGHASIQSTSRHIKSRCRLDDLEAALMLVSRHCMLPEQLQHPLGITPFLLIFQYKIIQDNIAPLQKPSYLKNLIQTYQLMSRVLQMTLTCFWFPNFRTSRISEFWISDFQKSTWHDFCFK